MSYLNNKILNTQGALIVFSILLIVIFYLFLFLNHVWSIFFIIGAFIITNLLFLFVLYALYKLFYQKDKKMIKPLLFVLFVLLLLFFRVDRFFVEKIDESEYLLKAYHKAPLGFASLEIFKDSTFIFSQGGLGSKTNYKGTVIIKNDSLFFKYYDSIPVVGNKALLTKYEVRYEKHHLMERININRLIGKDSIE